MPRDDGGAAAPLFDRLEAQWESAAARRLIATTLGIVFAATLVAFELGRRELLPAALARFTPPSHFYAVQVAFYLLLAYEVAGLVFGLARSVANAAGKQLEIFSLILLRQSFEVFGELHEPLAWPEMREVVLQMLSDAGGALALFVILGLYYRLQRHRPFTSDLKDRRSFIGAKKALALGLLLVFFALGARSLVGALAGLADHLFFEPFYTLLVFADILVVLVSLRYSSNYQVVFRNSGLAVSTVLLRIALAAPPFANALLGLAAALFALALTLAYNAFAPVAPAEAPVASKTS